MSWMTWVLFVSLLWIYPFSSGLWRQKKERMNVCRCLTMKKNKGRYDAVVVADTFTGFINANNHWNQNEGCIIFLRKNTASQTSQIHRAWPQMVTKDGSSLLLISKWHINRKFHLYVLDGEKCNDKLSIPTDSQYDFDDTDSQCDFDDTGSLSRQAPGCLIRCLDTKEICKNSKYNESYCSQMDFRKRFIINTTTTICNCMNCYNPKKKPDVKVEVNVTLNTEEGEKIEAAQAAGVMKQMVDLATAIDVSAAELSVGGVTGILVRETQPEDIEEVSFGYSSPNDSMTILENRDDLAQWSRSVTVTKEAFQKAASLNISVPFAAILRFFTLASDEKNSTILGDEVLAIEMGAAVTNLTDKMNIHFRNTEYEGIPSCQSWNGDGSRPKWTVDGCLTIQNGSNITCQCSHLTFFAILLTPLNETISSSDLKNLTIITQVGCGLSMVFLGIVIFMHFLLRRNKATIASMLLIHLVSVMFLLNFTFLINNFVAKLKSSVGCKIMAALMHYFMLATFTWFAVQAFHLCLQLYVGGKITIHRFVLKVSIISWGLPSVAVIVLFILGKYGEQDISASDAEDSVIMCWITDNNIHSIVNIGYYALVFVFTFTIFIIILCWVFCLKRTKTVSSGTSSTGKSIVVVMGLCCTLGITWGFAFFAYGAFRIPSYYIFTVLNSFQGFFLLIYYYNTSRSGEVEHGVGVSTNSTSTIQTSLESLKNPYIDPPDKEMKKED